MMPANISHIHYYSKKLKGHYHRYKMSFRFKFRFRKIILITKQFQIFLRKHVKFINNIHIYLKLQISNKYYLELKLKIVGKKGGAGENG